MELIKRKILLETVVDRNYDSPTYGSITATSFYVNVMLTQNADDMGLFTDITYLPNFGNYSPVDYTILKTKLASSGFTFPFMVGIVPSVIPSAINNDTRLTGKTPSDYYTNINDVITAQTESRIEDVRSYLTTDPYRTNFNIRKETYVNYSGETVAGVDRVTSIGVPKTYVIDADSSDPNIGTLEQKNGLVYYDFQSKTLVSYNGEGWNETNVSLSAITKEEYLFGVISKPEVKSDVFIDRGQTTIFEKHLKLSEIKNLDELARYGKGYFNLTKT